MAARLLQPQHEPPTLIAAVPHTGGGGGSGGIAVAAATAATAGSSRRDARSLYLEELAAYGGGNKDKIKGLSANAGNVYPINGADAKRRRLEGDADPRFERQAPGAAVPHAVRQQQQQQQQQQRQQGPTILADRRQKPTTYSSSAALPSSARSAHAHLHAPVTAPGPNLTPASTSAAAAQQQPPSVNNAAAAALTAHAGKTAGGPLPTDPEALKKMLLGLLKYKQMRDGSAGVASGTSSGGGAVTASVATDGPPALIPVDNTAAVTAHKISSSRRGSNLHSSRMTPKVTPPPSSSAAASSRHQQPAAAAAPPSSLPSSRDPRRQHGQHRGQVQHQTVERHDLLLKDESVDADVLDAILDDTNDDGDDGMDGIVSAADITALIDAYIPDGEENSEPESDMPPLPKGPPPASAKNSTDKDGKKKKKKEKKSKKRKKSADGSGDASNDALLNRLEQLKAALASASDVPGAKKADAVTPVNGGGSKSESGPKMSDAQQKQPKKPKGPNKEVDALLGGEWSSAQRKTKKAGKEKKAGDTRKDVHEKSTDQTTAVIKPPPRPPRPPRLEFQSQFHAAQPGITSIDSSSDSDAEPKSEEKRPHSPSITLKQQHLLKIKQKPKQKQQQKPKQKNKQKPKQKQKPAPQNDRSSDEEPELFCLCRQPEDGRVYIQCDRCVQWFHPECVGVTLEQAEDIKGFMCPRCLPDVDNPPEIQQQHHAAPAPAASGGTPPTHALGAAKRTLGGKSLKVERSPSPLPPPPPPDDHVGVFKAPAGNEVPEGMEDEDGDDDDDGDDDAGAELNAASGGNGGNGGAEGEVQEGSEAESEESDDVSFHIHSCVDNATPHQIAKQYSIPTKVVLEANKLRLPGLRQHSKLLEGTPVLVPLDALFKIYKSSLNETPHKIGKKFNVAVKAVLELNKERLPQLNRHSKLFGGTTILLPLDSSDYEPFLQSNEPNVNVTGQSSGSGGGSSSTNTANTDSQPPAKDLATAVAPKKSQPQARQLKQKLKQKQKQKQKQPQLQPQPAAVDEALDPTIGVCPSSACRSNADEPCYLVTCRSRSASLRAGSISILYLGGVLEVRPKSRIEAQDYLGKWMSARIIELDLQAERALVHFDGWNKRFDEFVSFNVDRMRPLPMQDKQKRVRNAASAANDDPTSPSAISAVPPPATYAELAAAKKKGRQSRSKPIELNNLQFDHPGRKISGRPDVVDDVIVADWTCPRCTLVNASGVLTCSACFSNKPRVKAPKARRDSTEVDDATGPVAKRVKMVCSNPAFPCGPCGVQFHTAAELVSHMKLASHRMVVDGLTSSHADFGDSHGEFVDADAAADAAADVLASSRDGIAFNPLTTAQRNAKATEKVDKDFQRQLTLASSAASAWAAFAQDDNGEDGATDAYADVDANSISSRTRKAMVVGEDELDLDSKPLHAGDVGSDGELVCICGKAFAKNASLSGHKSTCAVWLAAGGAYAAARAVDANGEFTCVCGKAFAKNTSLSGHKSNCAAWIASDRTKASNSSSRSPSSSTKSMAVKELMLPCTICKRVGDAGLQCRTCSAVYHTACVGASWESKMTLEGGDAECPKCESHADLCKCGSATHKRTYSKECPLNPKNIQAKATQDSLSAAAAAGDTSNGAGGAGGFANMEKDVAYGILSVYRRLLQRVQQPGWEGKDALSIGPEELATFPQNAFLQHNRVVLEHPTVKIRAKATTLESMLAVSKKTKLEFRMKVRQTAAQILSDLGEETLAAAGISMSSVGLGVGGAAGSSSNGNVAGGASGAAQPGTSSASPAPARESARARDREEDGSDGESDEDLNATELAELAALEEGERKAIKVEVDAHEEVGAITATPATLALSGMLDGCTMEPCA